MLLHIERLVGGVDVFVPYMQDYDRTFTGTSITTDQWRNHLFHYFGSLPDSKELVKKLAQLDWDEVSRLPRVTRHDTDMFSGFMGAGRIYASTSSTTTLCLNRSVQYCPH